jgi:hypothetical protein
MDKKRKSQCILENVLMDTHSIGNGFDWVICDFGFASFTSDSKVQLVAGLKKPDTKGITFRYAAPEVN